MLLLGPLTPNTLRILLQASAGAASPAELQSPASPAPPEPTALAGTPYYMAPEVIAQKALPAATGDVWSAGIVLVQMMCGRLPYSDLHPIKAMVTIATAAAPRLAVADGNKLAAAAVERCLQLDAARVSEGGKRG